MSRPGLIHFGPFRLDAANQELYRGGEKIHLRPKTFAVLRRLAERPGMTVTKEELSAEVWPDGGSDAVIKNCIHELRAKLGDLKNNARIIETRPWIGYRFIAEAKTSEVPLQPAGAASPAWPGLESEATLPPLPPLLKPLLEAYCYALKAECFDEACQMLIKRQLGESLFWGGYYTLADELLAPLIQAHLNRRWEATQEALSILYTLGGMIAAKSHNTKQAAVLFQKATNTAEPDRSFIPAGYLSEVVTESGRFLEAFEVLEQARMLEENAGEKESYRIIGRR